MDLKAVRCRFTEGSQREDLRIYTVINVDDLNQFEAGTVVTPELLKELGIVKKAKDGIKVLGDGKLEKSIEVKAHKFSKTAIEKIEAAGGKAEVI